ncbi:MAG TPA: site-2 protease family protein, partial [Nitrososphaera sp.]|nr:site-2 protease family protein [Nitrososphaera sp.]
MPIIIFIIILGILVLSHEAGHFVVAKLSGMKVEEFGFGFPPRLWAKKYRGTEYSINLIPFGGFVKIYGEDGLESEHEAHGSGSFTSKPRHLQAAVVVAGVVCNFLLAWGLVSLGYVIGLPTSVDAVPAGQTIQNQKLVISLVEQGSPAEKAGLKSGDEIVSLSV